MTSAEETERPQAVVVHWKLSDQEFGTYQERERAYSVEDRLEAAVRNSAAGEYDGHEFGEGWCRFYLYSDSAELLAKVVRPVLMEFSPPGGSFMIKRFGPPGAQYEKVFL